MSASTSDVETVERIIPAPAASIFAVLADPSRHHEIDGSGTVKDAKSGSQQLQLGSTFGMSMKAGLDQLEPVDGGGTRVRESWDISQEQIKALVRPLRGTTRKAMTATLARIEQVVTA